ncbi:MAG: efflux RND transporter permease subunit [Deltaproteobacteria bacterium]|nr:efflux RND transporter permease subunit [Deltaproteobacteria bacterium]
MTSETGKGYAGRTAEAFVTSKLTIVLVVASLLMGLLAVFLTPKEEEPQISVPMIDVSVAVPGLEAEDVEKKVTEVIERAIWGLDGVEYVYSMSMPHGAMITARFNVGEPIEPSLVKVHHKIMETKLQLPREAMMPVVKSHSIDDVPFLTLTFSSQKHNDFQLRGLIAKLAKELSSTPDLSRVDVLGGLKRAVRVIVNPHGLKQFGITMNDVARAIESNNMMMPAGKNWGSTSVIDIESGGKPRNAAELSLIPIGQRGGRVIRISDIAKVIDGPEERTRVSVLVTKEAEADAVSIAFAKRKGTNVVILAEQLLKRAGEFKKSLPDGINMVVTRNYGETAKAKSNELIEHLLIATFSVALLIAIFMGLRASLVVAVAIPVTLALTLAIYYFLGYTLNRVTLFALIFSIGILVDDAIVVVENIERHLRLGLGKGMIKATIDAVSEVGNPTILATITVIAAILPMAFVRGLMGPYMKPIPVGASLAMILSLFVAFIVTPWASVKLLKEHHTQAASCAQVSRLDRAYQRIMSFLLQSKKKSLLFGALTLSLLLFSCGLVYFKAVKVKMLPFDDKNEFQVLIDFPPETTLKESLNLSKALSRDIIKYDTVEKVQIYIGESAPFSFSGMVKHVFLRGSDDKADLQIVLVDKDKRKESSHKIIESLRPLIADFGKKHNAVTKVLEIPPGPPVLATMLAEVYGPTEESRQSTARTVYQVMAGEPSVVDLDTTLREGRKRLRYSLDYEKVGTLGVNTSLFAHSGVLLFSEHSAGLLDDAGYPEDISIDLSIEDRVRSSEQPFRDQTLPSFETGFVSTTDVLREKETLSTKYLYRKNLKPVVYVTSELSGTEEAPVYGMLKIAPKLAMQQQTAEVPWDTTRPVIKWDGEWFITYEVFRDLGAAFAVVIVLIYVLVLGWFKSFKTPLIIMAPIPISLIGILPGHALTGVFFTATSMIGFIAGAGIIVRNSIILVDFIEHLVSNEKNLTLKEVVIKAGIIRFRPMLLTAAAVVVGSSVMLFDPIFQGLAISLIFGEVAATFISRFAVPVLYYWFAGKRSDC